MGLRFASVSNLEPFSGFRGFILGYERVFTRQAKGGLRARPRWFQRPSNDPKKIAG